MRLFWTKIVVSVFFEQCWLCHWLRVPPDFIPTNGLSWFSLDPKWTWSRKGGVLPRRIFGCCCKAEIGLGTGLTISMNIYIFKRSLTITFEQFKTGWDLDLFFNAPIPASFCLFLFFSCYNFNTNWKSIDGVLGIRTWGRRMVGADENTELLETGSLVIKTCWCHV